MVDIKPLNLTSEPIAPTAAPLTAKPAGNQSKKKLVVWFLAIILLGVGSGYGFNLVKQPKSGVKELSRTMESGAGKGSTYGVQDEAAFKDTAEGELSLGGIDGEGSHHLIREGGESQYVYLTSSIIDLDQFAGKKVKVWGQTFEAQKAGWLMDVGRLEILE